MCGFGFSKQHKDNEKRINDVKIQIYQNPTKSKHIWAVELIFSMSVLF